MSEIVPDFLANNAETDKEEGKEDALAELQKYMAMFDTANNALALLTERLAEWNKRANLLRLTLIPALMNKYGFAEVTLADGRKVSVKRGVQVSVPELTEAEFYRFLAERNETDIIKFTVAFDRMEEEKRKELFSMLNQLSEQGVDYETKEAIHAATLKKYVTELLGLDASEEDREKGIAAGLYKRVEDLSDMLKIYIYSEAKVTNSKKKHATF